MTVSGTAVPQVLCPTSSLTLVTTSEEEFDYTLIGMETQPRTTLSEWVDDGKDPKEILIEIGYPVPIEQQTHSDLSDSTISEESDYEKQKAKRARKVRLPRSHSFKPAQTI